MTIKFTENGNTGEFALEGRLDYNASGEAEKTIFDIIDQKSFTNILLDMKDLEYISSAGLRIVKKIYLYTKQKGGELIARNAGAGILEVFEMTGFTALIKFEGR